MTGLHGGRRAGVAAATATALLLIGQVGSAHAFGFGVPAPTGDFGSLKDGVIAMPTWDGAYIGGHLGGAFYTGDDDDDLLFPTGGGAPVAIQHEDNDYAFLGGAQIGFNIQQGSFVYGLEGDVSLAEDLDYLASIRARFGIASGTTFVYATAGVGFVDGSREVRSNAVTLPERVGFDDEVGYVVGGGIEVQLDDTTYLGGDLLYYDFDDSDVFVAGFQSLDADLDTVVARVRLSFRLSGNQPRFSDGF